MINALPRPEFTRPGSRPLDWLDGVHAELAASDDVEVQLDRLVRGLNRFREEWSSEEWRAFCQDTVRLHPLREVIHQCPFTSHGYARPRGYPGDAELIDYLYADEACPQDRVGSAIYRFMHRLPCALSVRERRDRLAALIDDACVDGRRARVLSVACGHLREVERSRAVAEGRVEEVIAFDQDPESLALICRDYRGLPIRAVQGSIRRLLTGGSGFSNLDLVYSAGLYDYLSASTAARLTGKLFQMLRPGGKLLVGNFRTVPMEAGYIEAFMNWWLIYRTDEEVQAFASEIPVEQIASAELFPDTSGNVTYLSVTRA